MAIPLLPLLLLGVGVYALRRRRRSSTPKGETDPDAWTKVPVHSVVFVPPSAGEAPQGPSGAPGQPCDAPDGWGAWDEQGQCKTFWIDGETDDAIARLAREEWESRGRPTFSELCLMVPDPLGGELAPPVDNPLLVQIVASALQRYYGVGSLFPPKSAYGWTDEVSPYWVQRVWAEANAVVRKELCGS